VEGHQDRGVAKDRRRVFKLIIRRAKENRVDEMKPGTLGREINRKSLKNAKMDLLSRKGQHGGTINMWVRQKRPGGGVKGKKLTGPKEKRCNGRLKRGIRVIEEPERSLGKR